MKHGPHSKRPRGRTRRNNNNGNANRHYDSNGPEVRIRGTASQIFDKYQSLARDASSSGDRVLAESYLQHAEHYFRIMLSNNSANGRINALPGDPLFEQMQAAVMNAEEGSDDGDEAAEGSDEAEVITAGDTTDSEDSGSGESTAQSEETDAEPRQQQRRRRGPGARRPRKPAASQDASAEAAEGDGEAVVEKKSAPAADTPDSPDGGASEAA